MYNRAALPHSIGKFEVLEQLGRAFGTVYKARDPELQRLVAIKLSRTGSFATQERAVFRLRCQYGRRRWSAGCRRSFAHS